MTKYIIVKYASRLYPNTKVSSLYAVHPNTYTASQCNVHENFFTNTQDANIALDKMKKYNPTVDYGIVLMDESI
jgi:hypothetical protein